MNPNLIQLLCCPRSGKKLKFETDKLNTKEHSYPLLNDIPWLFKNPEYYFLEWSTKIENYLKEENSYLKYLQSLMQKEDNKLSRKRLNKLHEARTKNLSTISKSLDIFQGHRPIALTASTQQIHSYFQVIFRDWCWNEEENQKERDEYLNFVQANIQEEHKNILILGAGAARISYDLANIFPDKTIVSYDHNPFLFFTAKKIFKGEEVKLSDYSLYPKDIEHTAQQYKIKSPKHTGDNHHFILGRFPDLPFLEKSFDVIIAPWFFDILDTEYITSVRHTLRYLSETGSLLIYGPNNVHKNDISQQLTAEEIKDMLINNFAEINLQTKQINYLHNPLNSQNRLEEVMFLAGKKPKRNKENLEFPTNPDGIIYDPTFENYKAFNQTFFNILKHINQDITVEELAKIMQQEFNFAENEAKHYAESFISKLILDMYRK